MEATGTVGVVGCDVRNVVMFLGLWIIHAEKGIIQRARLNEVSGVFFPMGKVLEHRIVNHFHLPLGLCPLAIEVGFSWPGIVKVVSFGNTHPGQLWSFLKPVVLVLSWWRLKIVVEDCIDT